MSTTLQKAILTDDYRLVEDMIYKIAWKFTNKYFGDFWEWVSVCNEAALEAILNLDESKSQLQTYVYNKVHWRCLDEVRSRTKNTRRFSRDKSINFDIFEFALEDRETIHTQIEKLLAIDEYVYILINLLLNPPREIKIDIDTGDIDYIREALYMYCRHDLGWSDQTLQQTINQIRDILQ